MNDTSKGISKPAIINANGLVIDNVGKTYGFNSISKYTYNVGVSNTNKPNYLISEYQCIGYNRIDKILDTNSSYIICSIKSKID